MNVMDKNQYTVDSLSSFLKKISESGYGDSTIFIGENTPLYDDSWSFNSTNGSLSFRNLSYDNQIAQATDEFIEKIKLNISQYIRKCRDAGYDIEEISEEQ